MLMSQLGIHIQFYENDTWAYERNFNVNKKRQLGLQDENVETKQEYFNREVDTKRR